MERKKYILLLILSSLILIHAVIRKIKRHRVKKRVDSDTLTCQTADEEKKVARHKSSFLSAFLICLFYLFLCIYGLNFLFVSYKHIKDAKDIIGQGNKTIAEITDVHEYEVSDGDGNYHNERDVYLCTIFNLLNLLIAIALVSVHAWSNLFFILVIALNTTIGIVQELKAKRLVEKLSLLSMPRADIERNGTIMQVDIAEIYLADILLLESGKQICSDFVVQEGAVEVNESLLTGESDTAFKKAGGSLLSGSSIISGNALLFLTIGTVGIMGAFKMCYPFNKLSSFLFATTGIGFYAAVSLCLFFKNHILEHDILKMAVPDSVALLIFLIFTIVSVAVERILVLTIFKEQHRTEICPTHNFLD